jgi:arsenate reductase-like glutaredoxin family protein
MEKVLKWILLSYVGITIGMIIWQEYSPKSIEVDLVWSQPPEASITYFFGTKRCEMCKNMESWAREVSLTFDSVSFKAVPWQDDSKKKYVEHYNLLGNALILSFAEKGREVANKDLTDIWDVAHDEIKYKEYVATELKNFIAVRGLPAGAVLPAGSGDAK